MQDSEYNNATNTVYDQSLTISTALGSILGPLYIKGTESGKLPLVRALINSSNGTAGAYIGTAAAKVAGRPGVAVVHVNKLGQSRNCRGSLVSGRHCQVSSGLA